MFKQIVLVSVLVAAVSSADVNCQFGKYFCPSGCDKLDLSDPDTIHWACDDYKAENDVRIIYANFQCQDFDFQIKDGQNSEVCVCVKNSLTNDLHWTLWKGPKSSELQPFEGDGSGVHSAGDDGIIVV